MSVVANVCELTWIAACDKYIYSWINDNNSTEEAKRVASNNKTKNEHTPIIMNWWKKKEQRSVTDIKWNEHENETNFVCCVVCVCEAI